MRYLIVINKTRLKIADLCRLTRATKVKRLNKRTDVHSVRLFAVAITLSGYDNTHMQVFSVSDDAYSTFITLKDFEFLARPIIEQEVFRFYMLATIFFFNKEFLSKMFSDGDKYIKAFRALHKKLWDDGFTTMGYAEFKDEGLKETLSFARLLSNYIKTCLENKW